MIFIADYIALGIVAIISLFFFTYDHVQTLARKVFTICLFMTAGTAIIDIMTGILLELDNVPLWLNVFANTLYFVVNILTTSTFALFLMVKILEHVYERHCLKRGITALSILFTVYMTFVILNLFTGWLFYFDDAGNYCRGPLNSIGYLTTVVQMILVFICYLNNKRSTDKMMRRALLYTFPAIIISIALQLAFTEIMLNGIIMANVALSLFLNFKSNATGISTVTKLNNRLMFFQDVDVKISAEQPIQVLLLSLKSYSYINQKYGYRIGDEILYHFAVALEKQIPHASVFHMNGTTFALGFNYTDDEQAAKNLESTKRFLDEGIDYMSTKIHGKYIIVEYISANVEANVKEFYERLKYAGSLADKAGLSYIRYTDDIGSEMLRRRYIIERLENIDEDHGYEVWLQPIFCLRNERFCSAEALIRLRDTDGRYISPGEFIPIAEQTGDINKITWFVVEKICSYLEENPDISIAVSINLPMSQMFDDGFASKLNSILEKHGIERRRICIEFTERSIYRDFEKLKTKMESLKELGYRFFLDDFGTGYSNFSCLLKLPFEVIKLDSNITNTIITEGSSSKLVMTLTELFHSMNLTVVAEGVETESLVEALKAHGIDRIQGYYYAKPMNLDSIKEFYKDKQ